MATEEKRSRIHFLDNLRTVIILLVVLYHAGGVYEASGSWGWFWIVDDPATNGISGPVGIVVDIFIMSAMFIISGYLAPVSLKNKTGWEFLKAKFKRLIIPWIVSVFTLIPLYKVIFLASRGLPQQDWTTYFHFSEGNITSQAWLWFLPILFVFNVVYWLLSKIKWPPVNISLRAAAIAVFIVGFVNSFGMDMLGMQGWTLTPLIDFQNERLILYFMMFLFGALCYQQKVFTSEAQGNMPYFAALATCWIPVVVYIHFLLNPLLNPGSSVLSPLMDKVVLWLSFYLALFGLLYVMFETFRRFFNGSGRLWSELNRNSYYVYIIHTIVIGVIAMLLLNMELPSVAKSLVLVVTSYAASNMLISLYWRARQIIK